MRRAIHLTACLAMWVTITVVTFACATGSTLPSHRPSRAVVDVTFACATGSTPLGWLARGGFGHLLVDHELRRASAANLWVIGEALQRYRARFGHPPTELSDLERAPVVMGILKSPMGGRYVLTGQEMGQGRGPVCRELDVPGGGGGHVLFADGRIEWVEYP